MRRHNIEFLWAGSTLCAVATRSRWRPRSPDVIWRGVRPDLVCHGPDEVIAAFVTAYDANQEIDSLEVIGGEDRIVLGARGPDLAIDQVEARGEIYNVVTIEAGKIRRIEDYLERGAALAAAGIKAPRDSR